MGSRAIGPAALRPMALSRPNLRSKRCPQTRSGTGVNRRLSTGAATAMVTIPALDLVTKREAAREVA